MAYARRAKNSRASSDALDTRVNENDSDEYEGIQTNQEVSISRFAKETNGHSNLVCAGCGKPMDVPMQHEDEPEVYCELCLRKKMMAVRDDFQIVDTDIYAFRREHQDFDVHEPGFQ